MNQKKRIPALVVVFTVTLANGQNLIPNPGFEDHTSDCGINGSNWSNIVDWYYGNCLDYADYYHECSNGSDPDFGTPHTWCGHQVPRSGMGYGGLITYTTLGEARSFQIAELSQPLDPGTEYCSSFWLNRADESRWITDSLHVFFAPAGVLDGCAGEDSTWDALAKLRFYIAPIDTIGWYELSGSFIADGTEHYMVMGNLNYDYELSHSGVLDISLFAPSTYFIDDVYLAPCDAGVKEVALSSLSISPVPVSRGEEVMITWLSSTTEPSRLLLSDTQGRTVAEQAINPRAREIRIRTDRLAPGLYTVQLESNMPATTGRLVIQ